MTRCHICGDTGYWTGLTRPHGDPDPPAEYTGPRCTDREATAILSSHQDHPEHRPSLATMADGTCGCTLCRALRDLLDTRRERDEAAPVLEAARWISDYCRAWYESYQRQTGDPEGNPDSAPPIESVNRVIHVIREYDAARAAAKDEGSGALHIGTPLETDHGGEGDEDE